MGIGIHLLIVVLLGLGSTSETLAHPGSPAGNADRARPATIAAIQGSGAVSPFVGETVRVSGIVVGDFQAGEIPGNDRLRGFFIQDPEGDGDPSTSDGLFVFAPEGEAVSLRDRVEVEGEVSEFNGLTQIGPTTSIRIADRENPVAPTTITLPESVDGELERYEGMLVRVDAVMTISQNYYLGRYGQMTLASPDEHGQPGRLFQPTDRLEPGADAHELAASNARRVLFLDDGQDQNRFGDNPVPVPYLGAAPGNGLRAGDRVSGLVGVLDQGRVNASPIPVVDYRLHPTAPPIFQRTNPRSAPPARASVDLRVASFNVLNFFSTLDERGADTVEERTRQTDKLVAAMAELDADILGLIEIENHPRATRRSDPPLDTLVAALNRATSGGRFDYVRTGRIGTDQIKGAFLFQPARVRAVGGPAILDSRVDPRALTTHNRPALAQAFEMVSSGERVVVSVNHFKSKGSGCDALGDPNTGDGQGNCNGTRTSMAAALVDWLRSDPTDAEEVDVLILGDLNAYAQEDPIRTILAGGFQNVLETGGFLEDPRTRPIPYSFTFNGAVGSLDHALSSASLRPKIARAFPWPINTDEPKVLDYNTEYNSGPYFAADPYRSSDHDPIVIDIDWSGVVPAP